MTYVRNPHTGVKLLCCWDDCERPGHDEIRAVKNVDGQRPIYIFCSEGHKMLYVNGQVDYGNKPKGSLHPLGLPLL